MPSSLQAGSSYLLTAATGLKYCRHSSSLQSISFVSVVGRNRVLFTSSSSAPPCTATFNPAGRITTVSPVKNFMDKGSSWIGRFGFGSGNKAGSRSESIDTTGPSIAQGPDDDVPAPGQQFAQFGAGCFWGVELAFQRVPGVTKTEVGYSQGLLHNPKYEDVCSGTTKHSEVVRVQYNPKDCSYDSLLDVFWARHDPTTLNRQGFDVGTQYRSGIYYYSPEQEKAARESMERFQKTLNQKIVTEILPAKKFYRAEEYHQQYLEKGGRFGAKQSGAKGCNDPIRCYG